MNLNNSNYAIIENNTVINVIIAESLEIAQQLFPDNEILDTINDPYLVMFAFKENGRWFPKKPQPYINPETDTEEPFFWHDGLNAWATQTQIDGYEETIKITLPIVE